MTASTGSNEQDRIVIVGGGHAAAQLCAGLAAAGLGARTHLVCEEADVPYHRPPLSKTYLQDPSETLRPHRDEHWYADAGITLHRSDPVVAIDRAGRAVELRSGARLAYARLVLATGTRARRLPHLPDALANVAVLRNAVDAQRLRRLFDSTRHLMVLGGGFIGLEIAASARARGRSVTVVEAAPRLLMRSVSATLAEHVLQVHREGGIDVRLGATVGPFDVEVAGDAPHLAALTVDGTRMPVELLVLGIGAVSEHELASRAGIECDNGIMVDPFMRTSDPLVLAIGDCASFIESRSGRRIRLESVQNANDQARTALATLLGREEAYVAVPSFWSDQAPMRLQMAGLLPHEGEQHRRPGASSAAFSILHYAAGRLACVESMNAPQDHLAAKKLLEADRSPDPRIACDPATPLKMHL